MSGLLAMLQVNIALGILYIALRESRYRDKLFEVIAAGFRSEEISDDTVSKLDEEVTKSTDVSADYYNLAMWRGELPTEQLTTLAQTSADLFTRVVKPSRPPWEYRWFRCNGDKWTCFLFSVLIPIVLMWAVVCGEKTSFPFSQHYYDVVLVGQLSVGGHVLLGWWMVWRRGRAFKKKLREFIARVEGDRFKYWIRNRILPFGEQKL